MWFCQGTVWRKFEEEYFQARWFAVYEQQHAIYDQFNDIRYFIDENKKGN